MTDLGMHTKSVLGYYKSSGDAALSTGGNMKILLTGSEGFIGKHLAEKLKEHTIIRIDRKLNNEIMDVVLDTKFDVIIHCAAQTSLPLSKEDPIKDAEDNILATIHLLKNYKYKKFVYISTAAIYPDSKDPISEDVKIDYIDSPYGVSKYAGELYVKLLAKDHLILRLANVHGKGQEEKSEANVMAHFLKDDPIVVYGGDQTRDFIPVEEVTDHVVKCLNLSGTYNIGSGKATKIKDLAWQFVKDRGVNMIIKDSIEGEKHNSALNISKLERTLCSIS